MAAPKGAIGTLSFAQKSKTTPTPSLAAGQGVQPKSCTPNPEALIAAAGVKGSLRFGPRPIPTLRYGHAASGPTLDTGLRSIVDHENKTV